MIRPQPAAVAFMRIVEGCVELAHELIVSLDNVIDKEHEKAWDVEIERRVKEIKSGKAKGRPAEEMLAEIRAKYS